LRPMDCSVWSTEKALQCFSIGGAVSETARGMRNRDCDASNRNPAACEIF
jgi:hypothetical protein